MNHSAMAKGMVIAFAQEGIQIDTLDDTDNGIVFLFSVPKSSFEKDAHGKEMSGKHLASRIKHCLERMGWKFADIRYRIREEHWDENKAKEAQEQVSKYVR